MICVLMIKAHTSFGEGGELLLPWSATHDVVGNCAEWYLLMTLLHSGLGGRLGKLPCHDHANLT